MIDKLYTFIVTFARGPTANPKVVKGLFFLPIKMVGGEIVDIDTSCRGE